MPTPFFLEIPILSFRPFDFYKTEERLLTTQKKDANMASFPGDLADGGFDKMECLT
jgi:hypothetical protein